MSKKMTELQVLKEFKNGTVTFIDELIDQFPAEGDLIACRILLNDQMPIKLVMTNFTQEIITDITPGVNVKELIKKRDDSYFLEHGFKFMSNKRTSLFRKLWRSPDLDKEDRECIWRWVDSFVYLSEKYQKATEKTN